MRRVICRKKQQLSIQLSMLNLKDQLQLLGCVIQKLKRDDQKQLFMDWEDYLLGDDYSDSTASYVEEKHCDEEEDL